MDSPVGLLLLAIGLIAYGVLRFWLPAVAKKDMDRRGQPGWAYDMAVWWIWPIGLLGWWAARRRYPILDEAGTPKTRARASR